MKAGNADFWYAYRAYFDAKIRPSEWAEMNKEEKAIIIAFTDIYIEQMQKATKGG